MIQLLKLDADEIEYETLDQYIGTKFMVHNNGDSVRAKVMKHARDNNGNPVGTRHTNPLLDSREYECVLDDGTLYRYMANIIPENIFAQCNDKGRSKT